jgi:glyoxylate reductase
MKPLYFWPDRIITHGEQTMSGSVFVTRRIPQAGIDLLKDKCAIVTVNPDDRVLSRAELLEGVRGRDGVLCLLTDKIDGEVMDAAKPTCRVFANYAVGYDNIDLAAARARSIRVTNTPGVLTDATADMTWSLLFAAARRIAESDKYIRTGQWAGWGPMQFLGQDITGRTLGIVGAGRIGTNFALKSLGFKMKVLYTDMVANSELETRLGARKVGLEELLANSDFISLHVALTPETRHLIGKRQFELMKPTAVLINTARGPIIDEQALVEALKTRKIAAAGLDVYENEPKLTPGLTDLDNIVICPHTASATVETRTRMAVMAAENLLAVLAGKEPPNAVI